MRTDQDLVLSPTRRVDHGYGQTLIRSPKRRRTTDSTLQVTKSRSRAADKAQTSSSSLTGWVTDDVGRTWKMHEKKKTVVSAEGTATFQSRTMLLDGDQAEKLFLSFF